MDDPLGVAGGRPLAAIVAICAAASVLACAAAAGAQPMTLDPRLTIEPVVESGLDLPTTMAFLGPDDFLVLEKDTGRVLRVIGGVVQPTPALDVAVSTQSERGLLGIAINTQNPPGVFLYYTEASDPDGDGLPDGGSPLANRAYRYTWNASTGRLEGRQLVLDLPVFPGANHDGGTLLLGPPNPGPGQVGDGALLFTVIGDLNHSGQLQNQTTGAPDDTGVIFRVKQDGSAAPGNPFVPYCSVTTSQTCPSGTGCPAGETCRTEVARYFAYGVRNSFGLALDPSTGDLWDTENGPALYDEVNRVPPGFNSGWSQIMGPDVRDSEDVGDLFHMPGAGVTYADPIFSWLDTVAPTAIVFPAASALGPAYDATALVGDANNGLLYGFPLNPTRSGFDLSAFASLQDLVADTQAEADQLAIASGFGSITDLKLGPDGKLYIVDLAFGTIHRISARLCGGQPVTIVGTGGDDVIQGTPGPDVIHGLGGNDTIDGRGGNDVICGGGGNDQLLGGQGNDLLIGGNGNDDLRGNLGADTLKGGKGFDVCQPGAGDTLSGCEG